MPLLQCQSLVKVYPGGKRAVDGISFEVEHAEIVGLLGPNGAGKTTAMRMITAYLPPSTWPSGTKKLRSSTTGSSTNVLLRF